MIINTCRPDPRGPCGEDAGAHSAPRSADVTAQALAGYGHFARTGSPPPKPAFLPLRPTSCIAVPADPAAANVSVLLPHAGEGCSRLPVWPVYKVWLPPLGFCSASLIRAEVEAGQGSRYVTGCCSEVPKVQWLQECSSAGDPILRWPGHPAHLLSCPRARGFLLSQLEKAPHCPAGLSTLRQPLAC